MKDNRKHVDKFYETPLMIVLTRAIRAQVQYSQYIVRALERAGLTLLNRPPWRGVKVLPD